MKDVYILGGSQTDFERNWSKEGKNEIALLREVVYDALAETGISLDDIKKLNNENRVAGIPSARYEAACASSSVAIDAASTKIIAGEYDVTIVIGWELMKTVDSKTGGDFLGRAAYYEDEAKDIDFPFPKLFGQLADTILEKYTLDETRFLNALATISDINYSNAKHNPNAQTRKWFMNKTLAVSDCSQVTDGAAVIVLASPQYVEERKLNKDNIPKILGWGHRVAPMLFKDKIQESKTSDYILPWTRQAVLDAYRRAQITVDEVDVFETHDCFTSSEYAAISAFGITEPGKEYEAIENGVISFNGLKPINPSGGLIGCGHPVGATGVRMFLDLYKQIAGKAGAYQINNAKVGAMLNIGGSATTNYVFIIGK